MEKSIYRAEYRSLVASLRAARRKCGLRQQDVAQRLRVSRTWLSKVERADIRLDVVQLVRLARIYGLRAHRLVKDLEEELSDPDSSFFSYQSTEIRLVTNVTNLVLALEIGE